MDKRKKSNQKDESNYLKSTLYDVEALSSAKKENIEVLKYPEKITLLWLTKHVPVRLWFVLIALVSTAFVAGIKSSKFSFIKEIFGL